MSTAEKMGRLEDGGVVGGHGAHYTEIWRKNHPATRANAAASGTARARRRKAQSRKRAGQGRRQGRRTARCRNGQRPRSRRRSAAFSAANPEPKTELKYVNPYTLLVAVVLSAQATDAGVNKATPALFAARRHAGEDGRARRGAACAT